MGLSCRCCKKKGRCACKACPTIASETLALEIDYKQFDINGEPFDPREDIPNGPLFGPEPPYPAEFEVQATCGYPKPRVTSDIEEGENGCVAPSPPLKEPLPCGEFAAEMVDPLTGESLGHQVQCPDGYTCMGDTVDTIGFCEPAPVVGNAPECDLQYDKYTCEANGPRMGRAGPSKKSTFFGIGLIPGNQDLIECTEGEEGGVTCPEGYECVESTDPPEQIRIRPPLDEPQSCDEGNPLAEECPDGYECECGNCEPEKVDAPLQSYCQLEETPCGPDNPCPEGYECVTNPDTDESFCEPLSGELTKDFLQHPIQAQFGLYPCENPHKNEVCAPLDEPIPCDIPDCVEPVGKLPDQCEECTDGACQEHFGDDYRCNRDGDCEKENSNPCPEGYECKLDPANPIVETFPSIQELPSETYDECKDSDCETEFGPGFRCNNNGECEIDPEDGTDENCQAIFGQGFEYYPTQPIRDGNGNKVVCDLLDDEIPDCEQSTGDPDAICEDGECNEIVPSCQRIPTNCLPLPIEEEPDWIFQENEGLPVFLVPTDGLPYGPLPLDGEGGTRKRRYDELWKGDDPDLPAHIGACNEIDVTNGECSPNCCYETFGDPWLPNHTWTCRQRTRVIEPLEEPIDCEEDTECPDGYRCENGSCVPANLLPELEPSRPCDDGACPAGYRCVEGFCRPTSIANPDAGLSCYLEPIDSYDNPEDDLDSLIRDFPEFRELECPDIDQYCGPGAPFERYYLEPQRNNPPFADGYIPADCDQLTDFVRQLAELFDDWTPDKNYCEKVHGLGFECEEAQPTGITGFDTDADCERETGIPGSKCVTLEDGTKECYTPISCIKDHTKCPNGYDCINDQCQVDCEAKYGPGAECVDLVEPGEKEDRWCQPPCSDDICEEEYGPGFKCNDDGDCEAVRNRDLDSRIPRPIGEEPTYDPNTDQLYFGHTSLWGGGNDNNFGVGVFNIDTTMVRTRLYLDYGYHLHYPFDKGHMNTELVPSGCPVDKTPKTDVWKYKGNKGHRVPYPQVNTITIGNRYPSTHSFLDDEEDFDDFTKVGAGPYFGEYCDRAIATDEPGGLNGLGDPPPTNWNREANPSEDEDGNTIYAPQHENDDYSPKKDPKGIVKGCNPAFVVPCDTNPSDQIELDYLDYVRNEDIMAEDGLNRTGVCKKDMDDWRTSNQSVFSHNQIPSGPVGGLIIDRVDFVPVNYNFPGHSTTPDLWLYSGLSEYGPATVDVARNNRVYVPPTTAPVFLAVYYNRAIGRHPIRYDALDINQFLPPENGWLENIWQLGDIANPLDVENIIEQGTVEFSRPVNSSQDLRNFRKGYKYESMSNQDYIEEYDHLPVDRHWDMPSEETCVDPKQDSKISCAERLIYTRWKNTGFRCNGGLGDCDDAINNAGDPVRCIDVLGDGFSYCYVPPDDDCTDQKCNDLYDEDGDSFSCHGEDGDECIGSLCPDGYTCGPPDNDNMIVHVLPASSSCEDGICDQFGDDYSCIEGGGVSGSSCQSDEDCEEQTGIPGSTCNGDGECVTPTTCQKPNRFCTPIDACEPDPAQGFFLQSCGDDRESLPPLVNQRCGTLGNCPTGYECENGNCVPIVTGADDVKLTKHLFDFWNDGTPFPSNNGDVTDGELTWFKSELDQYGEVQIKPWINVDERDLKEKYPERNLFGVEAPDEINRSCEEDPCPPGYRCDRDSNLCVPGEGSLESQVTYPPLLYTGLISGGYKTLDGIKNQVDNTEDRAIKQWFIEQPYHPGIAIAQWSLLGSAYHSYIAQIGVDFSFRPFDLDWFSSQYVSEQELQRVLAKFPRTPEDSDVYYTDVREVYRTVIRGDQGSSRRNPYNPDEFMHVGTRSSVGLPTGSYHGRDGMLRYNIHPWAQIYNQMRITDSLLEMGRDFHEVQKVLSSLELECKKGIFRNGTPTIVEPFGYDEAGNVQFQLNQPHGSHLAELITPRILNYRPTGTMPPGNAKRIKIGGPGQAMCIAQYLYPIRAGGNLVTELFMPDGSILNAFRGDLMPDPLPFAIVAQTYPGYARGASATPQEESFAEDVTPDADGNYPDREGVETEFGPVEFHTGNDPNQFPSYLHNGAFILGKVYGVSAWPMESSVTYIAPGPDEGINGTNFPEDFYVGGHGYFDPGDLRTNDLVNDDPDMGLFTFCFIAGMNSQIRLPGLPRAWTFGMVGGSFWDYFSHRVANGNAGSLTFPDFSVPQGFSLPDAIAALGLRRGLETYNDHYFSVYDAGQIFTLTVQNGLEAGNTFTGTIEGGTVTKPDGTTESKGPLRGDAYARQLVLDFMTTHMNDDFLRQFYYAQVRTVRGDGPLSSLTPIVDVKDVTEESFDVHLILEREGESGRLVEGPGNPNWQDFPQAPRYYRTAKYQRLDGEDCVDTYDKECAIGGSSPCGDASDEGVVVFTLDAYEGCEDCEANVNNFTIPTDDWVCVEGEFVREDDPEGLCGDNMTQGDADQYCQDMYGAGFICDNGRCKAPMTCEIQGLLPANMNSALNGILDQIVRLPINQAQALENILPKEDLSSFLEYDDDGNEITGVKDKTLYYIANEEGSHGCIAPNGQIITDEFLRDLHPDYFYRPNGDPTQVSIYGAVLDYAYNSQSGSFEVTGLVWFSVGDRNFRPDFAPQEYICAKMTDPQTGIHNSEIIQDETVVSYGAADMNQCIRTSRFYSGERSKFLQTFGTTSWLMEPGIHKPPFSFGQPWEGADEADVLGATPFHWPWAIGDLCVDWAAGPPRRGGSPRDQFAGLGGNMGSGIDGRFGFNHENALENVKHYYAEAIEKYGPQENQELERTIAHNEFPNSQAAHLYKLAIISGTTNAGDMLFYSDSHRQKNDILQAKPPCELWTNIYDFKWPLTPATGINTPPTNNCDQRIIVEPKEDSQNEPPENEPPENEPIVNTVHGRLRINISEKPTIRFKSGGTATDVSRPDKLWFAIDSSGCEEIEEHDPPKPCDATDPNDDCGEDYECRPIKGCDDSNTYCMPKTCTPTPREQTLEDYRADLGFQFLVLQPTTNPILDNHVRCPIHNVEIPHWGPKVQLKSALFNRDLITIEECSECDINCDCKTPEDPEPLPELDPEQICGRWEGDEECPEGYDCECHLCRQKPFKECVKADAYGCRRCLEPTAPTITITTPEDQSEKIYDPEAGPDGFDQDCDIYIDILDNDGQDDTGCGSDEDCYSAVDPTVERYSNFREQYPYITTEEIQCGDPCQFLNICPPGFECNDAGDFCDPIPFGHVPAVNGIVEIKANATGGSGASIENGDGNGNGSNEDSDTPTKTEFTVDRVIFTITELDSDFQPMINTQIAIQGTFLGDDTWTIDWDTRDPLTEITPDGIFEIRAAVYDTGDQWCLDVITVRTSEKETTEED